MTYDADAGFEIETFKMNGVDEIPELDKNGTTVSLNASDASSKKRSRLPQAGRLTAQTEEKNRHG
ncbi:MAG: hypothetical protein L6V93_22905 [Clostridiales bacterium]|nr:MAG: hypothetical protein L6V93_22905 [Clostridiales bacterium]